MSRDSLKDVSFPALVEELARRLNEGEAETPKAWCEDCAHFKTKSDATDRYNPCQKKHKMGFHLPDDLDPSVTDDGWGFYRTVCKDRKDRPMVTVKADPPVSWESPQYRQEPPSRGYQIHSVSKG